MRHAAAVVLFACGLSVQASTVYGQAQEDSTATAFGFEATVTEQAALLSRPFVLGETLGKLAKGDTLRILGAVEGYVHAAHDGQEGTYASTAWPFPRSSSEPSVPKQSARTRKKSNARPLRFD